MAYEIFGKDMTELYSEPSSQAPDVKKEEQAIVLLFFGSLYPSTSGRG